MQRHITRLMVVLASAATRSARGASRTPLQHADTHARNAAGGHPPDDVCFRLRPNRGDPLHDLQLQRDMETINARTARALGPPPFRGPSAQARHTSRWRDDGATLSAQTPSTHEDSTMQWTSVAAIAALATSGTLAACGANGTQPQPVDPPTIEAAAPSTSTAEVQAVPPAADTAEVGPDRPLDAQPTDPVRGPAIPAAKLRQQIVALLGSLQTLEDLERVNVERVLDVKLRSASDMRQGYEYDGITSEGWSYGVLSAKLGPLDAPSTVLIGLHHQSESASDQQPALCTMEFDPLAKELVAMGYEQGARAHDRGGDMTWGFGRDSKDGTLGFGVGVIVYTLDADGRTCVGGIRIGGGPLDG